MIRKSLYPEYYGGHPLFINGSNIDPTKEDGLWHIGKCFMILLYTHEILTKTTAHCVDSIRQSLMCNIDVSTVFWEYNEDAKRSVPSAQTTHTCRDWDRIHQWAVEHRLTDHFDDKYPD
jgi:hypothetical protein